MPPRSRGARCRGLSSSSAQAACGEVSRQLTLESHLASSHRAVRVLVSLRASCGSESRTRGPAVAQHKDREMLVGYFSEARRQCRLRATTARRIVGLQARSRERPVAASELPRKRADGTWRRRSHRYGTVRVRYGRRPVSPYSRMQCLRGRRHCYVAPLAAPRAEPMLRTLSI